MRLNFLSPGLELFLDEISGGGADEPEFPCELQITHSGLADGTVYGQGAGMEPGEEMFTESGVPVRTAVHEDENGDQEFGDARVVDPDQASFGNGLALRYLQLNGEYDITASGHAASRVTFVYFARGRHQNLQVNGEELLLGNLHQMPRDVAADVTLEVEHRIVDDAVQGEVVLTGPITSLVLGGRDLTVDEFCITRGVVAPGACTDVVTNEAQTLGQAWGGTQGDGVGDVAYTEGQIALRLAPLQRAGTIEFEEARIAPAACGAVSGKTLELDRIGMTIMLQAVQPVSYVSFRFCDCDGFANLLIGSTLYQGDLRAMPFDFFGPDLQVDVLTIGSGSCTGGEVRILGELPEFTVAGASLQVDDICVVGDNTATGAPGLPGPAVQLLGNHPNPFNPATTVGFALTRSGPVELTVVDLRGRHVATLLRGERPAGRHEVRWNGRDDAGRTVGSGIYLVRLSGDGTVSTHKIALMK
jgi:hypothetical protein